MSRQLSIDIPSSDSRYKVEAGHGLLARSGVWARKVLGKDTQRIAIVSDPKVFGLYGDTVTDSLESAGFAHSFYLVKGGEGAKNLQTVEKLLRFLSSEKIRRTDAVLAMG